MLMSVSHHHHLVSGEEGAGGVILSYKGDAHRGPQTVLRLVVFELWDHDEECGDGDGQSDLHGLSVGHQCLRHRC